MEHKICELLNSEVETSYDFFQTAISLKLESGVWGEDALTCVHLYSKRHVGTCQLRLSHSNLVSININFI